MDNRFIELLKSKRRAPVVVAHRGDSFHAPENTLEAGRAAKKAGAHAWEIDVQLTRDGVPVLLHDESLKRTTDVAVKFAGDPRGKSGWYVSDFEWKEVETLDAGSWFVADSGGYRSAKQFGTLNALGDARKVFATGAVRIPTLEQTLRLTAELDFLINVELKSFPEGYPGLARTVLETIERTETASRVLISCFDHRELAKLRTLTTGSPDRAVPLGVLQSNPLHRPGLYTSQIVGAQTCHLSADCLGAHSTAYRASSSVGALWKDVIDDLRATQVPLLVWTVNAHGPGSLTDHLAQLGAEGLITDDPAGMLRSFG
ncbi:MAG: glycerophosphodiester phosphodiesterase family protein [Paludisphaera borealis]|uniref:glycerophosphodiester phosphodiesterase n=1 Tax=Paludisphaera borealis TaxID=1387353 RepID=UPI0028442309|nr:glycerophosphodiester phosphodiesterase family protein [Paludisphaera borealis]MDR3621420.1 glycerophosphodiester phosphodiesterase family protein [Paludisphaera borealis]